MDATPANKILWLVGRPRPGPLLGEGRPLGKTAPVVAEPGCWQFKLKWAGQTAVIELVYR